VRLSGICLNFDDPLQHETDSDRLNAAAEPHLNRAAPGGNRSQWGDPMPAHFINYATP
jgi:hypothetical protein